MILFLRAHRGRRAFLLSALASTCAVALTGRVVALPQLLQGFTQPVNVGLILALAMAPITAGAFSGQALNLERAAHRRLLTADLLLTGVVLGPVLLLGGAALALGESSGLGVLRDFAAFAALSLGLLPVARPPAAATVPVAYFLLIATLGLGSNGHPPWWAWLRRPATSTDLLLSLALLLSALTAFHLLGRKREIAPPDQEL